MQAAAPGPQRAARACAVFSRQLAFQRLITFHPQIGPRLQAIVDQLPPRGSTLIEAAALYSKHAIPWQIEPGAVHQISVTGRAGANEFLYSLADEYRPPRRPGRFAGRFALWPLAPAGAEHDGSTVAGELQGQVLLNTYGIGAIIDMAAAMVRQTRGDLKPPWDRAPGTYNHHDRAAMARFRRDLPHFDARLEHYLKIENVVDEFDGSSGPRVLLNLKARIRPEALKPFPHLYRFYRDVGPRLTASSDILDTQGGYWMRSGFDRGQIYLQFLVEHGMLTPFNADLEPAGPPVAIGTVTRASYRIDSSVQVTSLGMQFGLDRIDFVTDFHRSADTVTFRSRMDAVPQLVAPPVLSQVMRLLAGRFLRVMAKGNGGLETVGFSRRTSEGMYRIGGGVRGDFYYSPTLEFLTRIGDRIARADNAQVRKEERALGEQLFDAFVEDYSNARPRILKLTPARSGFTRAASATAARPEALATAGGTERRAR